MKGRIDNETQVIIMRKQKRRENRKQRAETTRWGWGGTVLKIHQVTLKQNIRVRFCLVFSFFLPLLLSL